MACWECTAISVWRLLRPYVVTSVSTGLRTPSTLFDLRTRFGRRVPCGGGGGTTTAWLHPSRPESLFRSRLVKGRCFQPRDGELILPFLQLSEPLTFLQRIDRNEIEGLEGEISSQASSSLAAVAQMHMT